MKIVATYDFNGGKFAVKNKYETELAQVTSVINAIDAILYKTKESTEKTMMGKMLFSPIEVNKAFKREFAKPEHGEWSNYKVLCDYTYGEYTQEYVKSRNTRGKPFRDMDFVKPNEKNCGLRFSLENMLLWFITSAQK